jgi:predicted permease
MIIRIWRALMDLIRRNRVERELDEEPRTHLEHQIEQNMVRGMDAEESRYAAQRLFGGLQQVKERCRDVRGLNFIESIVQDLQYGFRQLRRNPGFTAIAVITLALGIGTATAMFSVIDNVLLRPFPYKNAGRYTTFFLWRLDRPGDGRGIFRMPEFLDYRKQNHVFEDMIGYGGADVLYKGIQGTEKIAGAYVTANTFDFLGVRPLLGRGLSPDDGKLGSPPVFVMNYRLWESQFHGDRKLLGQPLTLNAKPTTLVGIMPPRFQFADASIWLPLSVGRGGAAGSGVNQPRFLVPIGLRKPGVSLRDVASYLNVVAHRLAKIYPKQYAKQFTVTASTLTDSEVGQLKPLLYILLAAVIMLLLIACSNVANLLLARATTRQKEIAVHAAVGASRSRLIRQLLVESLALAVAGALFVWFLSYGGLKGAVVAIPEGVIPASAQVSLNPAVLLFASAVTVLTALLSALAPALHSVRGDLDGRLREAGQALNARPLHGQLRGGLVIAEVAISIVLMAGAGLMLRTFFALERVDLGFNPEAILHAQLLLPQNEDNSTIREKMLLQKILDRVKALPGVNAVSIVAGLPPYGGPNDSMMVSGQTFSAPRYAMFNLCSSGYFAALQLPLIRGRLLSETDIDSARLVSVINQTLARHFFGKSDPLGQEIKFTLLDRWRDAPHNAFFRIIGVVGDSKNDGPQGRVHPEAFLPYTITVLGMGLFSGALCSMGSLADRPERLPLAGRSAGRPHGRLGPALVVAQVSLSLALLVSACLLLETLRNIENIPIGIDTNHIISAEVNLPAQLSMRAGEATQFFDQLETTLAALPGVTGAGLSDSLPPGGPEHGCAFFQLHAAGYPPIEKGTGGLVGWRAVSPSYFKLLNIPIIEGRWFVTSDRDPSVNVIILSKMLAGRLFPGENPIGRSVRSACTADSWYTVVGVVANVKNAGLVRHPDPEYYVVRKREPDLGLVGVPSDLRHAFFLVRSPLSSSAVEAMVRRAIASLHPALPAAISTLDARVDRLRVRPRFDAVLIGLFATLGLLLAAIGLYGLVSYSVAWRTHEIGVRMALGAQKMDVLSTVIKRGMELVMIGGGIGLGGALALTRFLRSLLYGVRPTDQSTFATVSLVLLGVAALACYVPARRATKVDPAVALRHE